MSKLLLGAIEPNLQVLKEILDDYEVDHPGSTAIFYRYNSVSIRIKIIDPAFEGLNEIERERIAYAYLDKLPDEIAEDVTLLLLFTPKELASPTLSPIALTNLEFDEPKPSRF